MDITMKEMQEFDKEKKMKKVAGSTNKRAFCPTFLSTAKSSPVLQLVPADDIKGGSRDGKKRWCRHLRIHATQPHDNLTSIKERSGGAL